MAWVYGLGFSGLRVPGLARVLWFRGFGFLLGRFSGLGFTASTVLWFRRFWLLGVFRGGLWGILGWSPIDGHPPNQILPATLGHTSAGEGVPFAVGLENPMRP